MSVPNPIPHKTLYINDYICSCYAFVFIFEFSEYISKHILQFHAFFIPFYDNRFIVVYHLSDNFSHSLLMPKFTVEIYKSNSYGMTILEQILAGLQQKFTGVDTAILTRIATKKAEGVTDETKVNSIVEGISFSDVLNSYGDFRAGDASKTAVSNYEKKHNLKDGKSIENPNPNPNPKLEDKTDDMAAIIANAVSAAVKPLSDKLAQFETEKLQATRQEQIMAKAKEYGIPENYAKRCAIKDDEDLDAYFKDLKQEFANDGFKGVTPPETAEEKIEKESESIAKMIDEGTKTIVEQNKN